MKQGITLTATIAVAAAFSLPASANLLGYDGFNYLPPGTAAGSGLAGLDGGTDWALEAPADQVDWIANNDGFKTDPSGGLSYGSLNTQTGAVTDDGTTSPNNESYFRQSSGPDMTESASGVRWFSFLLDADAVASSGTPGQRMMWGGLTDSTGSSTSLSTNVGFSILTTATSYEISARFRTTESASRIAMQFDETLLIVGKYTHNSTGNDFVEIWLNPDASTLGGADITSGSTADGYASIANTNNNLNRGASAWVITAAGNPIGNNFTGTFDEVRIGDTYADVTPIPEPATLLLATLGGLLVIGRRRRA